MLRFKLWSQWVVLPRSMRRAATVAVLIVIAGTTLLYQTNVRSERPPRFGRGGPFAGSLTNPNAISGDLSIPTASPTLGNLRLRSSATLTAPSTPSPQTPAGGPGSPQFPSFARYVYDVQGYEQATAFGRRDYPPEMTTTIHRTEPSDPDAPALHDDEAIYDLFFSNDHEEREIVAFRPDGILFTYEAGSITFGPVTQTSEATYDPPMLQIPIPLTEGTQVKGASTARDANDNVIRVEDWTVTVQGRENIDIRGHSISTWIVQIDRQSSPGSSEQVTRSRTYWFDPQSSLWLKWHETLQGSQDFGPGTFNYQTEFTATLNRVEPLGGPGE